MDRMSGKQWKRLDAVRRIRDGELTLDEAARVLGLSKRQVRRVLRAVERRGSAGLLHGNTGRSPAHRVGEAVRKRVLGLMRKRYVGFNDQHFAEKLAEVEGLKLSKSTVRRILRAAGIGPARKRRPRKHRRRRERKAQAGLMLLWDGSRHDWLEGRGPMMCLMGAIDDATGELLPGAHFVEQESAAAYLRVLLTLVRAKGIPWSAYMDQHGSLKRNDSHWTVEEELRGEQEPTHVGRALKALGIEPIFALSAQAKGRVERLWGTLQDRLCSELRLAEASTMDEANEVLERHLPAHNRRFAVEAREATPAWRPVRRDVDLERICSFRYESTVGNDNVVRIDGRVIDIPPGPFRRSYAQARVEVRQYLDGSWRVFGRDGLLATAPASGAIGELRTIKKRKRRQATEAFRRAVMRL